MNVVGSIHFVPGFWFVAAIIGVLYWVCMLNKWRRNGEVAQLVYKEIAYRKELGSRSEASKEKLRIKRMEVKGKEGLVNGN